MSERAYTFTAEDGTKLVIRFRGTKLVIRFADGKYYTERHYPDGGVEVTEGIYFDEKVYKDEEGDTVFVGPDGFVYRLVHTADGKTEKE